MVMAALDYFLVGKQRKTAAETERKTSSSLAELEMLSP